MVFIGFAKVKKLNHSLKYNLCNRIIKYIFKIQSNTNNDNVFR